MKNLTTSILEWNKLNKSIKIKSLNKEIAFCINKKLTLHNNYDSIYLDTQVFFI